MHESSLALGILDVVVDQAAKAGRRAVRQVDLCVGEFVGVETTTLRECFDLVAEGTLADGARLEIERIPVTGVCQTCGGPALKSGKRLSCPVCEQSPVKIVTGRELYVKSIEVE